MLELARVGRRTRRKPVGLAREVAIAAAFAKCLSTKRAQDQRTRAAAEIAVQLRGQASSGGDRRDRFGLGVTDLEDRFRLGETGLKKDIIDLAVRHTLLTRFTSFVVVDESEIVRRFVEQSVTRFGMRSHAVASGAEAMAELARADQARGRGSFRRMHASHACPLFECTQYRHPRPLACTCGRVADASDARQPTSGRRDDDRASSQVTKSAAGIGRP